MEENLESQEKTYSRQEVQRLISASKALLHLHACEQEGFQDSQPTTEEWYEAVNNLEEIAFTIDPQPYIPK